MSKLNTPSYAIKVVKSTPHYMLAVCGPVFIVEWRDSTPLEGCHALRTECERYAKTRPEGVGLLTIVQATAPPPESKQRDMIANFLRGGSDYIKCSAVVVEGDGFRASLVRGVVIGLTMLARQKFPHQVQSMPNAVAAFARVLEPNKDPAKTAQALEDAINAVRVKARMDIERSSGVAA